MTAAAQARPRSLRPFRLTPCVAPEDDLHVSTVDLLTKLVMPPAEWACYPAGDIKLTGQQKAKLYRFGLRTGWPDFLVLHGALYGIELKTETGQLSYSGWRTWRDRRGNVHRRWVDGQRDVHPRLLASGGFKAIAVCRSVDDVETVLRRWGVPLRGRLT